MPYLKLALVIALCAAGAAGQPEAVPMAAVEPVVEPVGRGTVRFHAGPEAAAAAEPTPALMGTLRVRGKLPENFPVAVSFEFADGRRVAKIGIEPGTSVYGGGGAPGPLLRNGQVIECWNGEQGEPNGGWPQSHPWVLAVRPDGTAFGVLAETSYRCTIDLTDGIAFKTAGPALPIVVIERETPIDVLMALAGMTGYMPLPPRWALGYHHGGAYETEASVRAAATKLRDLDVPCDAVWIGVEATDEGRSLTFSPKGFPDPESLNQDLAALGLKSVWRVEPAVAADPAFDVYDEGLDVDAWVKQADGSVYVGPSPLGPAVFPDFSKLEVRRWWASLTADLLSWGAAGIWNGNNVPVVAGAPQRTIHDDARHEGDEDLGAGTHARFHNVYGMQMAEASRLAWRTADSVKRPLVVSEAGHLGGQRFAAAVVEATGQEEPAAAMVARVLNLGLSGQPFAGAVVDAEGPARHIGTAAMLPFVFGRTAGPEWQPDEATLRTYRDSLTRRYRLLPYYTTLFREASISGVPVARPLFFADPKDPALRGEDGAFLVGQDLLVVPPAAQEREIAMPKGTWRSFHFGDGGNGDLPELRLRPGAVVPLGPEVEHTGESPLSPLTLVVSLDENGRAKGTLYEDDGEGYDYMGGRYLISIYQADRMNDGSIVVQLASEAGLLPRPERPLNVRVLLDGGREVFGIGTDGEPVRIHGPE